MMRKFLLGLTLLCGLVASAQTLSVTQTGSGNTAQVAVTSSGQFKLTYSAADNWGIDGWCDLVNDSGCATNIAGPVLGVTGDACSNQAGLGNYVAYSDSDFISFMHYVDTGCTVPSATKTMTIVSNTPSLVVLHSSQTLVSPSGLSTNLASDMTNYIYPNGQIYAHLVLTALAPINLALGSGDFVMLVGLPNPGISRGSVSPDTQNIGWVRASSSQNPYNYQPTAEPYVYAYWGTTSPNFTKASVMIVPSPSNQMYGVNQIQHSWSCGTNCGTVRWGYTQNTGSGVNLAAGQSVTWDYLIQLGTQGSSVLPDMRITPPTNCAACDPIANAYIAQPTPPVTNAGLLTGMTPNIKTVPTGWTLFATQDFESGSFGSGEFGSANFVTDQFHSDGNVAHTHSIECQVGIDDGCGAGVTWTKPLPSGTQQVYVSWYERLSGSFRMNDEMFLMRFWWNTGVGNSTNREAILDYFQNSLLQYNSTNATLLWNIQFTPGNYYQNKLPSNKIGDLTNHTFELDSWRQHEVYVQYSTTQAPVSVGSSVTLTTATKTYSCTTCDWVTLGLHVGDSPHFTGFTNPEQNGKDFSGGAYTYFVTSIAGDHKSFTVTGDPYNGWTNQTVSSGATVQIDHADGSYRYFKNGREVAHQDYMIFPGWVDFSTQATELEIGASYSKLIWHQPVSGSCETSAPFTGACSTGINGCGYDNLSNVSGVNVKYWNGSGLTKSAAGGFSTFDTHINCDATWGGPMPTPPVFKRYLDDIIVLTRTDRTNYTGGGGSSGGGGTPPPTTQKGNRGRKGKTTTH